MKKWTNYILLSLLIVTIAIHLFGVHSKLLFQLNPDKLRDASGVIKQFSFMEINENNITAIIFAWSYAIATAIIIALSFESIAIILIVVSVFGFLDGFGVFIYYNIKNFDQQYLLLWGGLYYGLYTFVIIISAGYFKIKKKNITDIDGNIPVIKNITIRSQTQDNNGLYDKILQLHNEGKKQFDIARELSCSQSLVSKIINQKKNSNSN